MSRERELEFQVAYRVKNSSIGDVEAYSENPLTVLFLHAVEIQFVEVALEEDDPVDIPILFGDKEAARATISRALSLLEED